MCNENNKYRLVRLSNDYYQDSYQFLDNIEKFPCDVILVTKEKLELRAHKVVLARFKFWRQLFESMVGANGVCPGEPLIVVLPDYDYKTVRLVVSGYYCDKVTVTAKENEQFTQLVRAFNQDIGICNNCRLCKKKVSDHLILEHVKNHIKSCADNDKKGHSPNLGSELRCSFKQNSNCTISYLHHHKTLNQTINHHYRHHFREELAYIKQNFNTEIPNELSLFEFADIRDNDSSKDEEFENIRSSWDNSSTKRVDQDPSLYYPTTDRIEDVEDDYSGGMSSPEMSDDESNDGKLRRYPVMEGRDEAMVATLSRSGSTYTEDAVFTCRECGQKFKSKAGFQKHIVSKHVSKELEQYILDHYGPVNKKSVTCNMPGKCYGKKFKNMSQLKLHVGTTHNILTTFLADCRQGESIQDWNSSGNLAGRRSSGVSEKVATTPATELETIEISDDDDNEENLLDSELQTDEKEGKVIVDDDDSESDRSTLLPEQTHQMDFE